MSNEPTIQERADKHYLNRFDDEMRELVEKVNDDEDAIERLQEMPLALDKLTTDHRNETITWELLLGTGGPADRVLVTTDLRGWKVESAVYEFQDWFEPWTAANSQDAELVMRFAEIAGYYETSEVDSA